jgi:hypothetical protein
MRQLPVRSTVSPLGLLGIGAIVAALSGCASKEGPTAIQAPRGEHPAFAESYPTALQEALDGFAKDEADADALTKEFSKFPDSLKKPTWPLMLEVYKAAEEDGKNGYYGEVLNSERAQGGYFDELKPGLVKRAGGAVDYEAKKNKCEGEYFGAVSRGLDKGYETDAEERLDAASRAQRLITQKGSELPKAEQETLRAQARKLALAIYLVNISLPARHARLVALEAERSKVERTLKHRKEELTEAPPADKASPEAKKSHSEEQSRVADAQTKIEGPHTAAKQRLETSEKAISEAQDRIDDAVSDLLKAAKASLKDLD